MPRREHQEAGPRPFSDANQESAQECRSDTRRWLPGVRKSIHHVSSIARPAKASPRLAGFARAPHRPFIRTMPPWHEGVNVVLIHDVILIA
jgi:hypothetical protein